MGNLERRGWRGTVGGRGIAEDDLGADSGQWRVVACIAVIGELFSVVPPFRGRAIRMLKPGTPFEKLEIDFVELQRRKEAELAKLERVISYATTKRCRQMEILDYFGDPDRHACGSCDRCSPEGTNAATDRVAVSQMGLGSGTLEAVRIALSGAARTRGRVGKLLLAKMLGGSTASQVKKLQLHRLSTFGLLNDLRQTEVVELLDALIQERLLSQQELQRHRPTVQITEHGSQVMRGEQTIMSLAISAVLAKKLDRRLRAPQEDSATAVAAPLAREPQTCEPQTCEEMKPSEASAPMDVAAQAARASTPPAPQPSHYWTWRLFFDRYSRDECLAIRGLDEETIISHLARAVDEGREVRPEWFLTVEQLAIIAPLADLAPAERLRMIVADLPDDIRYEHVAFYLKCIGANTACQPDS